MFATLCQQHDDLSSLWLSYQNSKHQNKPTQSHHILCLILTQYFAIGKPLYCQDEQLYIYQHPEYVPLKLEGICVEIIIQDIQTVLKNFQLPIMLNLALPQVQQANVDQVQVLQIQLREQANQIAALQAQVLALQTSSLPVQTLTSAADASVTVAQLKAEYVRNGGNSFRAGLIFGFFHLNNKAEVMQALEERSAANLEGASAKTYHHR